MSYSNFFRDLKTSNIFFSQDGKVKIGDFGLSKQFYHSDNSGQRSSKDASGEDHSDDIGTMLYMSPEQLGKKSYDHKIDIFALGIILFELVYPFGSKMERASVLKKLKEQKFPKNWESFSQKLGDKITDYIKSMIASDPDDRPEARQITFSLQDLPAETFLKKPTKNEAPKTSRRKGCTTAEKPKKKSNTNNITSSQSK